LRREKEEGEEEGKEEGGEGEKEEGGEAKVERPRNFWVRSLSPPPTFPFLPPSLPPPLLPPVLGVCEMEGDGTEWDAYLGEEEK